MDAETFTDLHVVPLSHKYVCIRVDALREPDVIHKFHVTEFPETLITDDHGRTLAHLDGYADAASMAGALQHNSSSLN
jgi:thioredoxin-related protein